MRKACVWFASIALLLACNLTAADPPYVGRWKVNEAKTDYGNGPAFTITRTDAGELRFKQGDVDYIVRFDGREYPHPLGGVVSWSRLNDRTWENALKKDGKMIGSAVYTLSDNGETLTTAPPAGMQGSTVVYRRTSSGGSGLEGAWTLKTPSTPGILEINVADGYDLVIRQGGALCKANFDGKDYPTSDTNVSCVIARTSDRSFSFTVKVNGRPVAVGTRTVSEDGRTLTQVDGAFGQAPSMTVVYDRQ
jgi:hypothetical protein